MSRLAKRSLLTQSSLSSNFTSVCWRQSLCLRQFSKTLRRHEENDQNPKPQDVPPSPSGVAEPPSNSPAFPSGPAGGLHDTINNKSTARSPSAPAAEARRPSRPQRTAASSFANQVSPSPNPKAEDSSMVKLASLMNINSASRRATYTPLQTPEQLTPRASLDPTDRNVEGKWHLHVYSHKHNAHITLTRPNGDPALSLSNGNIGFKHSQRKNYEAAFQLAVYAFGKIKEKGLHPRITQLEVILNGFGKGREAITKVLLGSEGRALRNRVVKISDATKLKFGGVKSKNVRRL